VIAEASSTRANPPTDLARDLHEQLTATREPVTANDGTVAVPLLTEAGVQGSLGVTQAEPEPLTDQKLELLMTAAHQISVAVENARLYRQRQESMQSYVRRVTEAQEEERLRIARDLHDDTAQELVGLVRRLEQLRNAGGATMAEPVDELLVQARATLQGVRRYSQDLRPSVLDDLGLLAALEMVVEGIDGHLAGGARLHVTGEPRRLEPPVELALFRIAQEALRNVEKHAEAISVTVELDFGEEAVRLGVIDDGRGFTVPKNVSDLARVGKLGLLGMKERAELVGGSFELSSSRGRGTNLAVTVAMRDS
jgi:signal transduction histidine kinase